MNIKEHFEYKPYLDLTASNIGINKWDWKSISTENEDAAKTIMKENRFDVLPIINSDNSITKYFSTRNWNNYENLNLSVILESDRVYYRLSFCDLIRKFSVEKKHYYFLTDYNSIVGLVSFINLNCQAVYNYLFQLISDVERSVACFLKLHLTTDDIISSFKDSNDAHVAEVLKSYEKAASEGFDNSIFEYMYLQTLGIVIKKMSAKIPNKQKKLLSYHAKFSPQGIYGILRNKIMHPVRPILNDEYTISNIYELIQDYEIIKELLSNENK